MLSESDLRELVGFSAQAPVLSLYLNTDPSEGNADATRLRARSMIKDINLPQDIEAIQRYLDLEYNGSGRGLAIFSCAPARFFRAYALALPVRSLVTVADRPSVKILADLLDNYGGYGVALVDKQGARLFHFHLGTLLEQEGVLGEEVKHTKRGGASSFPGRMGGVAGQTRAVEEQVERNMRESADFCVHFFEEKHIRRILLGGTEENITLFRAHLPKAWQSLVVGAFAMPMTASHLEVQARAMQVGTEAERKREAALIDTLLGNSARGSGGVVGLAGTLDAVNEGRVQTLIITEGLHKNGLRQRETGALAVAGSADDLSAYEKVFDVVDLAVSAVMRSGGVVEVVHENDLLEKSGGIGALLRY